MNYKGSLQYLDNFSNYEKKAHELKSRFSLSQIRALMRKLDHPEKKFPAIHVAGTVGKGSVCHILEAALTEAGFKTGLYTSPHLIDIRERIRLNGRMIRKPAFTASVDRIKIVAGEEYDRYTYFEILTAAAFLFFADSEVDIAIIETGLGGRLDATNVVPPFISIITQIGWDHQHVLGNTLSKITAEKAGIIKRGANVVSAPQRPQAKAVIEKTCLNKQVNLFPVGVNEIIETDVYVPQKYKVNLDYADTFELELPLEGNFQKQNLAVAMKTIEILSGKGFQVGPESIINGVEKMCFPGRMERIPMQKGQGEYLLDGAHNQTAANALACHIISAKHEKQNIILIVGMMKDKDAPSVLRELSRITETVITCGLPYERAFKAGTLSEIAKCYFSAAYEADTMKDALEMGRKILKNGDLLCVTGSLYAVAEAKKLIQRA